MGNLRINLTASHRDRIRTCKAAIEMGGGDPPKSPYSNRDFHVNINYMIPVSREKRILES
jgi:hypothetical protein